MSEKAPQSGVLNKRVEIIPDNVPVLSLVGQETMEQKLKSLRRLYQLPHSPRQAI